MLERILAVTCREPDVTLPGAPGDDPLAPLRASFPDLDDMVRGADVIDFGCGLGEQAIALAEAGAASVLGVDINPAYLDVGRDAAWKRGVADRVTFATEADGVGADVVLSVNSMEHFSDPGAVLATMRDALRPGGLLIVTFSPPWLSAYGAHMHHFTPVPWVHLLFPERTIMRVRARYQNDGATRYEDVEGGLNRMTLRKFERLVRESGMAVRHMAYTPMKGLPFVTSVPVVREFCTTRVDCVLEHHQPGS